MLYVKRIRLNAGGDYAQFRTDTGRGTTRLWSWGGDLVFDINLFRQPASATSSVKLSVWKTLGPQRVGRSGFRASVLTTERIISYFATNSALWTRRKRRTYRRKRSAGSGSWRSHRWAVLLVMLLLTAAGLFGRMPSFEELENPKSNLATEIYSEDGKVIGSFFVQNRSYVQYADLFPADSTQHLRLDGRSVPPIVAALVATEDARFRSHSGIDLPSLVRVGVKTVALRNTSQGGGSTISQQLAKNLFPRDTVGRRGRIARTGKLVLSKLKEWITALKLEYNYTKEEIAAMYLNTVEYGSNAYGIKSAAHTFFNKEPHELNIQEAAMLVGVVNAPTRYSARAQPRERPGAPQPRVAAHGGGRSPRRGAARLALRAAHRAELQTRVAQRGLGDLLPRDAAPGDERRQTPAPPLRQRLGLRTGRCANTRRTRSTAGAARTARPTARPTTSTATD